MSTDVKVNNNAALIVGLREAADYLDAHPDIPQFTISWLYRSVYKKEELRAAAKALGSFTKEVDEHQYALVHQIGPLKLEIAIRRDEICTKRVIWDCPDDPLLGLESVVEEVK